MLKIRGTEYTIEASEDARKKFEAQTSTHKNEIITRVVLETEDKVLEGAEGTPEYGESLLWYAEDIRNAFEETGKVIGKANMTLEI